MKSFPQIKNEAQRSDWTTVAGLAGCSSKNVKLVVSEARPDNYGIRKIFSDLLTKREQLAKRFTKKRRVAA
jgi:hypothetical protein